MWNTGRTSDFKIDGERVNRLQATKHVASRFIERRRGDRLGLILFGTRAYLQAPLTFDDKTVNRLLREAAIGLAIVVIYFRNRGSIEVEDINMMKG